jgi:DNA-binding beta-propeller fold protein YncE
MGRVIAYVVSGTATAGALTPVDTVTHIAGSPIVIGGGAQSIAVTPNGKTVYVPTHNTVTPVRTATNTVLPPIPMSGVGPQRTGYLYRNRSCHSDAG